jgi:hypothetical protein
MVIPSSVILRGMLKIPVPRAEAIIPNMAAENDVFLKIARPGSVTMEVMVYWSYEIDLLKESSSSLVYSGSGLVTSFSIDLNKLVCMYISSIKFKADYK